MPARGDLQRQAHAIANPFDEEPPRIQEYTAKEIATLQSRLEKQLGPEYISSRKGPGGQTVHYLGAEKIINLANEVFGFNGWSTSIRDTTIDYVDIEKDGRVSMGLSVIMRVTLKDGTFHEDVGYGMIQNSPGKGAAFEKTKKEAATDAMKRALRNFGNVLGNCLYDKDYLKKVVKIKPPPSKWSEDNLHRHQDVMPRKPPSVPDTLQESPTEKATSLPPTRQPTAQPTRNMSEQSKTSGMTTDYDDEFGGNAFDDVDFTRSDEFVVNDTTMDLSEEVTIVPKQEVMQPPNRQAPQRTHSMPQQRPQPNTGQQRPVPPPQARPPVQQQRPNMQQNGVAPAQRPPVQQNGNASTNVNFNQPPIPPNGQQKSTPENMQQRTGMQPPQNGGMPNGQQMPETPVGFVRGRMAEMVANGQVPTNAAFDPHAESPSIRKTSGFDHRKSAPIRREDLGAPAAPVAAPSAGGNSFTSHQVGNNAQGQVNGAAQHQGPTYQPNMQQSRPVNNFVNPQQDTHRRIGAPMQPGMQSPGPRPGGYRPPGPAGVKRGPPDAAIQRPPLNDISNRPLQSIDAGGGMAGDTKRPRVSSGQEGINTGQAIAS